MNSGIYQIRNLINGKIYVGSAVNIKRRWGEHKKELRKNKHCNSYLQNAWNKYREENFIFEVLEKTEEKFLVEREQIYLDKFCCYKEEFGYNICEKAGNSLGYRHSEKTKKILSEKRTGYRLAPFSEEHKKRLSESLKGGKTAHYAEDNYNHKLNWEQVKEIRELYNSGKFLQRELAEKYNISEGVIYKVVKNIAWYDKNYHRVYEKIQKGEDHPSNKLNWKIVKEIREKYKTGTYSQSMLAKEYRVEQTNISFIVRNKTWLEEDYIYKKQVPINNLPENNVNAKLNWSLVAEIREQYFKKDISASTLARKYNISVSTVCRIIKNKSWVKE